MKHFLRNCRARRFGYDGWALKLRATNCKPWAWTTSTTREEAREIKRELEAADMFSQPVDVVKVRITVEVVGG